MKSKKIADCVCLVVILAIFNWSCSNSNEDQLTDAIENNDLEQVRTVLTNQQVNVNKTLYGFGKPYTPFFKAAIQGNTEIYKAVRAAGGDPTYTIDMTDNVFSYMASQISLMVFNDLAGPASEFKDKKYDYILADLIAGGADINFRSNVDVMAEDVFYRMATGMLDDLNAYQDVEPERQAFARRIFKTFIDHGVNMEGQGYSGTALIYHIERSNEWNVELLLQLGMDPNKKGGAKNEKPLWYAKHGFYMNDAHSSGMYTEGWEDTEMIDLLKRYGAKD